MEPFKNLLGFAAARNIAKALKRSHPKFDEKFFLKDLENELAPLELKERMVAIAGRLSLCLEPSPKSFGVLVGALKQSDDDSVGLSGFLVSPLTHFVALHGLDDFEASFAALEEMTKVFTAEFAVRPFFIKDENKTLKKFSTWARSPNEHVRRLASEGSRPLLPWGQKLHRLAEDPTKTWPILKTLANDPAKYVQKSVANHMNDISKKHSDWLVDQLKDWPNPWVVRHALRSLVKKGHPGALKVLGVSSTLPEFKIETLKTKRIKLGQSLDTSLRLKNVGRKAMKIVVDIEVSFLKANGTHSGKVFKGRSLILEAGETKNLLIRTPIKAVTTRKYHFGTQHCAVMINGQKQKKRSFILTKS